MIEYLYDAIRARSGEEVTISAKIKDDEGNAINNSILRIWDDDKNLIVSIEGVEIDGVTNFTVSADTTKNLIGRYWYCIGDEDTSYCFRQPIYLK